MSKPITVLDFRKSKRIFYYADLGICSDGHICFNLCAIGGQSAIRLPKALDYPGAFDTDFYFDGTTRDPKGVLPPMQKVIDTCPVEYDAPTVSMDVKNLDGARIFGICDIGGFQLGFATLNEDYEDLLMCGDLFWASDFESFVIRKNGEMIAIVSPVSMGSGGSRISETWGEGALAEWIKSFHFAE
jgi:hypothetical protein